MFDLLRLGAIDWIGKPDDLDDSPEARMENFPKRRSKSRPASANATGEGGTDELAENTDSATVRIGEADSQRRRRAIPDLRRRAKESRRE